MATFGFIKGLDFVYIRYNRKSWPDQNCFCGPFESGWLPPAGLRTTFEFSPREIAALVEKRTHAQ